MVEKIQTNAVQALKQDGNSDAANLQNIIMELNNIIMDTSPDDREAALKSLQTIMKQLSPEMQKQLQPDLDQLSAAMQASPMNWAATLNAASIFECDASTRYLQSGYSPSPYADPNLVAELQATKEQTEAVGENFLLLEDAASRAQYYSAQLFPISSQQKDVLSNDISILDQATATGDWMKIWPAFEQFQADLKNVLPS